MLLAASLTVPGDILVLVNCSDQSSAHARLWSGEHNGTVITAHPYLSLMKLSPPGYCSCWQGINVAIIKMTRLFYVDPGGLFAPWYGHRLRRVDSRRELLFAFLCPAVQVQCLCDHAVFYQKDIFCFWYTAFFVC